MVPFLGLFRIRVRDDPSLCLSQKQRRKSQPPKVPAVRAQTFRVSCAGTVGASPPGSGKRENCASSTSGRRGLVTLVDGSPPLPLGHSEVAGGTNPSQSLLKSKGRKLLKVAQKDAFSPFGGLLRSRTLAGSESVASARSSHGRQHHLGNACQEFLAATPGHFHTRATHSGPTTQSGRNLVRVRDDGSLCPSGWNQRGPRARL